MGGGVRGRLEVFRKFSEFGRGNCPLDSNQRQIVTVTHKIISAEHFKRVKTFTDLKFKSDGKEI